MSSTATTSWSSRRTRPFFLAMRKVLRTCRSSTTGDVFVPMVIGSAPGAAVVADAGAPGGAGDEDGEDGDERRREGQPRRRVRRQRLIDDVGGREVADERQRDDEREEATEPRAEDVERVLRQEVAAVGEGVGELLGVDEVEGQ